VLVLNVKPSEAYTSITKQTNAHLIEILLYCSLFSGAIDKEQYNKLSITFAFVCFIMYLVNGARYKGLKKPRSICCYGVKSARHKKRKAVVSYIPTQQV
jgi:hypothetical protein